MTHHDVCLIMRRGSWVRMARKACWPAYCKFQCAVGHPGTSGVVHFTFYILEHAKSVSGILNRRLARELKRSLCVKKNRASIYIMFKDETSYKILYKTLYSMINRLVCTPYVPIFQLKTCHSTYFMTCLWLIHNFACVCV